MPDNFILTADAIAKLAAGERRDKYRPIPPAQRQRYFAARAQSNMLYLVRVTNGPTANFYPGNVLEYMPPDSAGGGDAFITLGPCSIRSVVSGLLTVNGTYLARRAGPNQNGLPVFLVENSQFGRAFAYVNGAQAIVTATNTILDLERPNYDSTAYSWDDNNAITGGNCFKILIAGTYLIGGSVSWDANATGIRTLSIFYYSSSTQAALAIDTRVPPASACYHVMPPFLYDAIVGDLIWLQVTQSSGGNLNVNNNNINQNSFWIQRTI